MKRKLSVFSMIAGHSLGRVFGILLLQILLNGLFFYDCLVTESWDFLDLVLNSSDALGIFSIGLVLMTLLLGFVLRDKGGRQNCFLHRLSVSPRRICLEHGLYNSLCFLLLFSVEALCLLGGVFWHSLLKPEAYNHQSIMLGCYNFSLLHTFFPLADWLGWVVLGVLILGLGFSTAAMSAANRRGKRSVLPFLMLGTVLLYGHLQLSFQGVTLDGKIVSLLLALPFTVSALWTLCRREVEEDE